MYSVSETIENGALLVTASPGLWIKGHILYWPPPGQKVDRSVCCDPGPDWIPIMCRVLKENIETYDEALEQEAFYSKHRNSDEFREEQTKKQAKRDHPVLHNQSDSDLIDVNDMIKAINAGATKTDPNSSAPFNTKSSAQQKANYHKHCADNSKTGATKKPVVKRVTKTIAKAEKKPEPEAKVVRSILPFRKNYLQSRVSKLKKREDHIVTERKRPRYDNFLKSGRSNNVFTNTKNKRTVPSSTITKREYLNEHGETSDIGTEMTDEKQNLADVIETRECNVRTKPSADKSHKNELSSHYDTESNAEDNCKYDRFGQLSNEHNEVSDLSNRTEIGIRNIQHDPTDSTAPNKIVVLENILIEPSTKFSSQPGQNFEDKIMKHLNDLANAQKLFEDRQFSFEERMEKKIDAFLNNQPRPQCSSRSSQNQNPWQHEELPRMQYQSQTRQNQNPWQHQQLRRHGQSRIQGQSRSAQKYSQQWQPQEFDDIADEAIPDFDAFEELDQNFPIIEFEDVAELEYNVRKDLELQLLLKSRLNEITGGDPKKAIRLKMKYLFSDPVLERYTWRGTEKKRPFKSLKSINQLLYMSVRKQFKGYKQFEYKKYMVEWLKHAKSRQRKVTYTYPDRKDDSDDSEDQLSGDDGFDN